jgi:hypothetical protein
MRLKFLLLAMIGASGCGISTYYTYAPQAARDDGEVLLYQDAAVTSTVSVVMFSGDNGYTVYPSFNRSRSPRTLIEDIEVRLNWSEQGRAMVVPPSDEC